MNNDDSDSGLHDELDLRALSAYVDGELPEEQRAAIETQLRQHPQATARVAAWRAQKAALRALCGAPDSDARQAQAGQRADDRQQAAEAGERSYAGSQPTEAEEPAFIVVRRTRPWWQRAGLAACWLAAGAGLALALGPLAPRLTGGAWSGFGGQPAGFAQRADVAYAVYSPERRHPVEVAASEEEHLITWLSKRLNRPLSVPSLQEYGYSLVGGRLLPGEAGPAAQFMYENQTGARLTLYVTGVTRNETAFRLFRDGNRRTFYWISDGMGYALSGAIAEGKLREIAIDVCSELGGKPETWQQ
ncbi:MULTISPECIES: anti-sigma factor family protein [unclassified Paraburkholderia]|uniref:anti-sigma factor family protein n=1 Tax=unclassified Paraburkholderia TaxID=2615204 RepID=UPI00160858B3|nr:MULTISPECIES: anti-sigma factor [unclassified Paraburkholderia]MBB5412925.1 anti-sigma factor RsiW [Paraburkholderia sp. HC6.4b]MBB5454990.1 anti-sigma factor RsiW [Paraburkholderia sp. Kb1A]